MDQNPIKHIIFWNQCITVHQRTIRYLFVHSSALFWCTFFRTFHSCIMLHLFSCCFMLHSLHVARFLCCTHFVLDFIRVLRFHIALFTSCNFFMLYPVHVAPFCVLHSTHVTPFLVLFHVTLTSCCTFLCCTHFVLHFFLVAFFSYCTLFKFHFSCVVHFSCSTKTRIWFLASCFLASISVFCL